MYKVKNLLASLAFIFAIGAAFAFDAFTPQEADYFDTDLSIWDRGNITVPSGVTAQDPCLAVPDGQLCKVGVFQAYSAQNTDPAFILRKE